MHQKQLVVDVVVAIVSPTQSTDGSKGIIYCCCCFGFTDWYARRVRHFRVLFYAILILAFTLLIFAVLLCVGKRATPLTHAPTEIYVPIT